MTIQPVLAAEPSGWQWVAWYVLLSASIVGLLLRIGDAVRFGRWSQVAMTGFFCSAVLFGTAREILHGYGTEAGSISLTETSWELTLPRLVHDWASCVGLACFALWLLSAWREYRNQSESEASNKSVQRIAPDPKAASGQADS